MAIEAPSFANLFRSSDDVMSFGAGSKIFSEGEEGSQLFAIQEGEVQLVVGGAVVETVGPGGIFGEMALLEHERRSATAIAHTDVKLAAIDERRFNFLTQNTPMFALNVLRVMARRLREMDHRDRDTKG